MSDAPKPGRQELEALKAQFLTAPYLARAERRRAANTVGYRPHQGAREIARRRRRMKENEVGGTDHA